MARRTRTSTLSVVLGLAAACLLAQLALTPLSAAFISPRAEQTNVEVPAVLGALAALGTSLPAQASYNWVGPLTGSEICSTKPIVWLIYPLCDPVFLVSPIYLFPITLIAFGSLVTVLNLLIPATQPDEDLR
mmetsp:Transcript_142864/g.456589  ORF Transcript_142864/g.456589 Transcript_142864/m.456589 type:complete len:132 (+) Transcript_142864:57-452(+)